MLRACFMNGQCGECLWPCLASNANVLRFYVRMAFLKSVSKDVKGRAFCRSPLTLTATADINECSDNFRGNGKDCKDTWNASSYIGGNIEFQINNSTLQFVIVLQLRNLICVSLKEYIVWLKNFSIKVLNIVILR